MDAITHKLNVSTSQGEGVLTVEQQGRRFKVTSLQTINHDNEVFGFDVRHALSILDDSSWAYQTLGIPLKIQYGTVILGAQEMRAQSLEDLKAALRAVKLVCIDAELAPGVE